jgi:hypothetical protein
MSCDDLELILSTVNPNKKEEIQTHYKKYGFVITVLFLIEQVWDESVLKVARETVESYPIKTHYYMYELLMDKFGIIKFFST